MMPGFVIAQEGTEKEAGTTLKRQTEKASSQHASSLEHAFEYLPEHTTSQMMHGVRRVSELWKVHVH